MPPPWWKAKFSEAWPWSRIAMVAIAYLVLTWPMRPSFVDPLALMFWGADRFDPFAASIAALMIACMLFYNLRPAWYTAAISITSCVLWLLIAYAASVSQGA